jgi:hypothetical protein
VKDNDCEITTPVSKQKYNNPEELLAERGLSKDDWEVSSFTLNEWDSPTGDVLRQVKAHFKRKRPINLILPASVDAKGYINTTPRRKVLRDQPELVVFAGDQQAPYHDVDLHNLFCRWLEANRPHRGVLMGDTMDFPDISRHRDNPEKDVSAQDCLNAGYLILRDYVQSSEETAWVKLCGNHDERIRNRIIDHQTRLHEIRPADIPGQEPFPGAFSLRHLLHLDDLGIEFIDPKGQYDQAQYNVSSYLAARHGWIARKGSGTSALQSLESLGYSIVVGHTHRQSLVHKTTHDINGKPFTIAGVETGCMCRIENGLGYAVAPDWQGGFATASLWPDGTFHIDLATYVDGVLYWRDQRYT